jgi:hypothetical protein
MASSLGNIFECNSCGTEVVWAVSKTGNKYLAAPQEWRGDMTFAVRTFLPSHKCTPNAEYQAKRAEYEASLISRGDLVKGQEVVVVKGRKVAIGTTGTIVWVKVEIETHQITGRETTKTRVGIKDADGTVHYTAGTNVLATNQIKEGN